MRCLISAIAHYRGAVTHVGEWDTQKIVDHFHGKLKQPAENSATVLFPLS
jgi:hypothetical protein